MAELVTLARPYAKAAFEFALSMKALQPWQETLAQAAAVSEHESVEALLSAPNLTSAEKGTVFAGLLGDSLDAKQDNFVRALAENNRLVLLPEISSLFDLYKANHEKSVDVNILSAFEISSELEQKLAAALKANLDRDIELSTDVDNSLIGGAVIRAGDTVIDSSTRGQLDKLAEAMNV